MANSLRHQMLVVAAMVFASMAVITSKTLVIGGVPCNRDYTDPLYCPTPLPGKTCTEEYPNSTSVAPGTGEIIWSNQPYTVCNNSGNCTPQSVPGTTAACTGT